MTIQVAVTGVGMLGPGLADWARGQALLREPALWQHLATVVPPPGRLPATERRRAGAVVRASIVAADEAIAAAGVDAAALATVFSSSTGDPVNCHMLCEALATPQRLVSPTRFTNSVHNAPAGYWHIGAASRQASTSLAAFDASFAAGLLEAAVQCQAGQAPVLLVACDVPYPEPLHSVRPVADVFAVALVLAPWSPRSQPAGDSSSGRLLRLASGASGASSTCGHAGLDGLRCGIPAARALPLLQALAHSAAASVLDHSMPGMALQLQLAAR